MTVQQPWCDVTPEAAEKAREAGDSFGLRREKLAKDALVNEVMKAEASILRIRMLSGDTIGNAQKISDLFASAAMRRWYETNKATVNDQMLNVLPFPSRSAQ